MGTELDVLVCENFVLSKKDQDQNLINNYKEKIELDYSELLNKFFFYI